MTDTISQNEKREASRSADALKQCSVLYVEDDRFTRDEMSFFLEQTVGTLYLAANGKEGLEIFREHRPDIIITDVQMPVMSGLEMLREIRRIDPDVPVVVTTAFNETNYLLTAINNGANRYLLKPINLKELHAVLEELGEESEQAFPYQSLDGEGRILEVNRAWLDFLGYDDETEVLGRYIGKFIAESHKEMVEAKFPTLKNSGSLSNVQFRMIRKDGTLVDVVLNAMATFKLDGTFDRTHCELRTIDFFMKSEARTSNMLQQERYLNGLITTHAVVGRAISQTDVIDIFLEEACDAFVRNTDCELAFIALREGEDRLRMAAQSLHKVIDMRTLMGVTISMEDFSECVASQAMVNRSPIIVDDLSKIRHYDYHGALEKEGITALAAFPIGTAAGDAKVGVLVLMFNAAHAFAKEEFELFESICETIAMGMQAINDRLEKEQLIEQLHIRATTDTLTGCVNRHRGVEILTGESERFRRYGHPLSIIFFDIDRFKQINDNYGHGAGDRVLCGVAETIRANIRATDNVVRWGGEEFIVILPETAPVRGSELAEKLRRELVKLEVSEGVYVTASFGVTALRQGESWEQMVSRADGLMYRAKVEGRDNVQSG